MTRYTTMIVVAALACPVAAQDPASAQPPVEDDEPFTLGDALEDVGAAETLRLNFDIVSQFEWTTRREEWAFMNAVGIDARQVLADDEGDIGVLVLQPYVVRRDNAYDRYIDIRGNDAFNIELHDFYLEVTKWGRGRTNIKVGHFDVPFGLEPNVDTHFTVHQFTPMHDAGFKKDWGVSLNGALPELDYEIAVTTGTGRDLATPPDRDPYMISARAGTPYDANFSIGIAALYGDISDEHGVHRHDEGDPLDAREDGGFVRRWRVGIDATQVIEQFTLRGQISGGEDFDQEVCNALGEVRWDAPDHALAFYLQGIYLGQNGFLGWDEDWRVRVGAEWRVQPNLTLSAQLNYEIETWASTLGDEHRNEHTYTLQARLRF